ncbi:MAG: Lrp/AsnC family transcriptional regulator [Actinomycetota bacterium]
MAAEHTRRPLDEIDRHLLSVLQSSPRASYAEIARLVGIARGTVYSRLDRLEDEGVIVGYGPDVDHAAAGLGVLAFATLEITQGRHDETIDELARIPEIVEIHTITGVGDLLCRIVAASNDELHLVLQDVSMVPAVTRIETKLALSTDHRRTLVDVLAPVDDPIDVADDDRVDDQVDDDV